ncbi:sulfite oxidase heme-binding subunit YedZ [Endozoicomonas sp. SCSIO W0465]|uniref:sulfite oxidase heme-binding subunit YedZ n=1 Tax=Endozoicomonas sp. SCSIO W0465 TaxID=2918516 RepID=UPI002074EC1F|nr:ferric reductase-like transmembrane domain-containing protein [Endozoicomonas sp. SCSIO W0465]USE36266.1 ferric reductase-like transmembrane domain-containing protein [Endozoicomonas sp. SCSIO W0465]
MLSWEWQTLLEDLYKRSYIIVGAFALSILIALGVTSTKNMMRRLGKQWSQLHRLVYVAAVLAVIHFLWLVKSDYTEPLIYGAVLTTLLLLRTNLFSLNKQ